ncbi:hypothetical protein AR687_10620 [Flavobacteriaceae bacterium CRH]|nr:hypothetical protein AR687_10620 [Flavobacteriaceae bacterium CRH]
MKTTILFFYFLCSVLNAQNKNQKPDDHIQKNIESCRISLNDSESIYKIHENLYNNEIEIILKTENVIDKECINETIGKELLNKINTSQNPIIEINKFPIQCASISDFENLIPNKICAIKKAKYTILMVELYSFSYTTVGSAYIDLCFKVDKNGKVIEKKMVESKSSMRINKLLKVF